MKTNGRLIIDDGFVFREYNTYGKPELIGKIMYNSPLFKVYEKDILLSKSDLEKIIEFINEKENGRR